MTENPLHILMIASENDAIPGAKVGGIGDVVRDVPVALCNLGHRVTVLIPAYGKLHRLPGSISAGTITTRFRHQHEMLEFYELFQDEVAGLRQVVVHHNEFANAGDDKIYFNDPPERPFATDANKYALFCQSACQAVTDGLFGHVDVLHLHDWHAALVAVLRAGNPLFATLQNIRCVFSIHNLAMQGVRPFSGDESSLQAWYPELDYDPSTIGDPRWPDCVNPVAAASRLCDKVHTVSPTYATEIQLPNLDTLGFHGGEGLEYVMQQAHQENRLEGILNGCDYSTPATSRMPWDRLLVSIQRRVASYISAADNIQPGDYLADQRLRSWMQQEAPQHVVTSVGRLTDQKAGLLAKVIDGTTLLERTLKSLAGRGVLLVLGTGDDELERFFMNMAVEYDNLLFINRYDQETADNLYASGDLFLMPSLFEPCGISQMISMKHGQPCLVHAVGGLRDTVNHMSDGFHFQGNTIQEKCDMMISILEQALALREESDSQNPPGLRKVTSTGNEILSAVTAQDQWPQICRNAAQRRFEWQDSAIHYVQSLYTTGN